MLRRLAKLGLVVVVGSYLAGCIVVPHGGGWGHERHGDRGGYGDRGGDRGGYVDRGGYGPRR
jgi:hypothetical protein